ncbi:unnamed protein product [Amoebophrya sp. A25]|nr:unnamed protein product [Amoebophrya sp. A25]|eukprot:GSA25T00022472001.1
MDHGDGRTTAVCSTQKSDEKEAHERDGDTSSPTGPLAAVLTARFRSGFSNEWLPFEYTIFDKGPSKITSTDAADEANCALAASTTVTDVKKAVALEIERGLKNTSGAPRSEIEDRDSRSRASASLSSVEGTTTSGGTNRIRNSTTRTSSSCSYSAAPTSSSSVKAQYIDSWYDTTRCKRKSRSNPAPVHWETIVLFLDHVSIEGEGDGDGVTESEHGPAGGRVVVGVDGPSVSEHEDSTLEAGVEEVEQGGDSHRGLELQPIACARCPHLTTKLPPENFVDLVKKEWAEKKRKSKFKLNDKDDKQKQNAVGEQQRNNNKELLQKQNDMISHDDEVDVLEENGHKGKGILHCNITYLVRAWEPIATGLELRHAMLPFHPFSIYYSSDWNEPGLTFSEYFQRHSEQFPLHQSLLEEHLSLSRIGTTRGGSGNKNLNNDRQGQNQQKTIPSQLSSLELQDALRLAIERRYGPIRIWTMGPDMGDGFKNLFRDPFYFVDNEEGADDDSWPGIDDDDIRTAPRHIQEQEALSIIVRDDWTEIDMTGWDVSSVTSLEGTWCGNYCFNQDISKWNVRNVKSLRNTFMGTGRFHRDLTYWDTSSVLDMTRTFAFTKKYSYPLNDWDVSRVQSMREMFREAEALSFGYVDRWDTSSVLDMSGMFDRAFAAPEVSVLDVSRWDVSKVRTMRRMFARSDPASKCRDDEMPTVSLARWDVSKVEDMSYMFANCNFTERRGEDRPAAYSPEDKEGLAVVEFECLTRWDVSSCKNFRGMFAGTRSFNHPLGRWNVRAGTDFSFMFAYSQGFNQSLENWDVREGRDFTSMFHFTVALRQDFSTWAIRDDAAVNGMFSETPQMLLEGSKPATHEQDKLFRGLRLFDFALEAKDDRRRLELEKSRSLHRLPPRVRAEKAAYELNVKYHDVRQQNPVDLDDVLREAKRHRRLARGGRNRSESEDDLTTRERSMPECYKRYCVNQIYLIYRDPGPKPLRLDYFLEDQQLVPVVVTFSEQEGETQGDEEQEKQGRRRVSGETADSYHFEPETRASAPTPF